MSRIRHIGDTMKLTKTQNKHLSYLRSKYDLGNVKPYSESDVINYLFYLIDKQEIEVTR